MTCPICNNPIRRSRAGIREYNFCSHCKTAWRKKFTKVNYQEDYYLGKSNLTSLLVQPIFSFFYLIRRMYAPEKVNTWIDVGAGSGDFLKTVNAKRRIGVEVSLSGRARMQKLGLEVMSDQQFLKLKSANADIVSFWHVLEHLEKPRQYLKIARSNLSKNGKLIVAVPNIDSIEFKVFGKFWFHLEPKFHQWQFSTNSITMLLKSQSFKVDSIDYLSPEHQFAGLLQSFINSTSKTQNVLHALVKRNVNGKMTISGLTWSLFWMTLGLPIIFAFWIIAAVVKRPGTFVIVASKK